MAESQEKGIVGRARGMSLSLLNATPQLGMWQATGTAIAQAPNLTELRDPESGGSNIEFDAHGHSIRTAKPDEDGELTLVRTQTKAFSSSPVEEVVVADADDTNVEAGHKSHKHHHGFHRRRSLKEKHASPKKESWGPTIKNGLKAFWVFFLTPSGFLITIYGLNIVAWGAMLFFLLLNAAPAMCHPSCNDDYSSRKIWLEIASQILNALFCVTGFGLAPWRFRDWYWMVRSVHFHDQNAMRRLYNQNKAWFRPPAWFTEREAAVEGGGVAGNGVEKQTFTGERAPPTAMWKLAFTVDMMVLNTLLQAVLCFFMWHYNRLDRPTWATGTFIALGCGVAMLAGLMSWWEGRKVKKIEGPEIKIETTEKVEGAV